VQLVLCAILGDATPSLVFLPVTVASLQLTMLCHMRHLIQFLGSVTLILHKMKPRLKDNLTQAAQQSKARV
jgi:hypothetical protein